MSISPFYAFFVVVHVYSFSHISSTFAVSVYKATGSLYFGIIPPIVGKATHDTLTQPKEGISILDDASYLYHKTNSEFSKIFENIFGSITDEVDSEFNQGLYKCENGACAGIKLDEKQQQKFKESLKGEIIKTGNALTKKVKEIKANSNIILPAPPLLRTDHIDFEEMERQRKPTFQRKLSNTDPQGN